MSNCWKFSAPFHGSHVRVQVRCGEHHHDRPLLGELVMDPGQWSELHDVLIDRRDVEVMDVDIELSAG